MPAYRLDPRVAAALCELRWATRVLRVRIEEAARAHRLVERANEVRHRAEDRVRSFGPEAIDRAGLPAGEV